MTCRVALLLSLSFVAACVPQEDVRPLADAGFSLTGEIGQEFLFDGSESVGSQWAWSLVAAPPDSRLTDAELLGADTPWVLMLPDVQGQYVLELSACDPSGLCDVSQTEAFVGDLGAQLMRTNKLSGATSAALRGPSLTSNNETPVAVASASQGLRATSAVWLRGSNSYDPDGDTLSYKWTFASLPATSSCDNSSILNASESVASFDPDVVGTYQVRLTVRDGRRRDWALVDVVVRAVDDDEPVDLRRSPQGPGTRFVVQVEPDSAE